MPPAKTKAKAAALLAEYERKRDFARTSEPDAKPRKGASGNRFVVQKHAARRLHYDFRLELGGVLKSWAVTRGPSLDPAVKRLAVRTEDHPLAYADFEGIIPQGEYGGGTVMLWDEGEWEPLHDPQDGLKEGMLHFLLHGKRMKGGWALVRMKPRDGEKGENWLLIKERDEAADDADGLIVDHDDSVRTGRDMDTIAKEKTAVHRSNRASGSREKMPAAPNFQLATLVGEPPDGDDWVHELKFDGYRCALAVAGGKARCTTRNGLDWTEQFGRIAAAAAPLEVKSALIDGEIVAFAGGRTNFGALHAALKSGGEIAYFAFDLLELDGKDLRSLPLVERKDRLQTLLSTLPKFSPIHYSDHVRGSGGTVLKKMCAEGLEGIISKRADSRYSGRRSGAWLKAKCTRRQEFVLIGWMPSASRGRPFASLLLGYYAAGKLIYSGRVGTGFNTETLDDLAAKFAPLARKTTNAQGVPADARRARWIEPTLVAEIAFTEVTTDGVLRHPSFLGLREDKEAAQVVRETAIQTPAEIRAEVAGVRLSNPEKVLFPSQGLTKSDLASYYEIAAERMLAQVGNRPLSLVRCPQGRASKCFFQKHDQGGFPDAMKTVEITEGSGEVESYYYVDGLAGLIAGVQMGVLEFHVWACHRDRLEQPDRLVFDLDPDEALTFSEVRRAAVEVRDRLEALGLKTWPLLTGGKGIHVVAPLARRAGTGWEEFKIFARSFARKLADDEPARFIAKSSKASRKGRIFIDWLRNDRGSTAIGPYSTRAREGAPVAMPVAWEELDEFNAANIFTVTNAASHLGNSTDPWAEMAKTTQSLTKAMIAKMDGSIT